MGICFDHAEWERYVPAAHDNRSSDEPCVCEIRPMTVAELRAFQHAQARVFARKKGATEAFERVTVEVIRERVRKIERCFIGRQIETGADLAEHGTIDLVNDVFDAIVNKSTLEAGLAKKFVGSSGF